LSARVIQVVQAADVEDEIIGSYQTIEVSNIAQPEVSNETKLADFAKSKMDCPAGKVYPGDLPAMPGKVNYIRASSTAEIKGASGRVRVNEFDQLRRGDAGIPGWVVEVCQIEMQF
jgi:hypothetical protein